MKTRTNIKMENKRLTIIKQFFDNFMENEITEVLPKLDDEEIQIIDETLEILFENPNTNEFKFTREQLVYFKKLLQEITLDKIEDHIDKYSLNIDGWDTAVDFSKLAEEIEKKLETFEMKALINDIMLTVNELILDHKQNIWLDYKDILIEVRNRETCETVENCQVYIQDWNNKRVEQLVRMLKKLNSMKGSK